MRGDTPGTHYRITNQSHWNCLWCGCGVKADEDGCCVQCGYGCEEHEAHAWFTPCGRRCEVYEQTGKGCMGCEFDVTSGAQTRA